MVVFNTIYLQQQCKNKDGQSARIRGQYQATPSNAKIALAVTTDDFCIKTWTNFVPRVLILVTRDERGRSWSAFKGGNWLKYAGNWEYA
jgi:hypothetical protein